MSGRTALDHAYDLEYFGMTEKAAMMRQQHAEIDRLASINTSLVKKSNAYVIMTARQDEEIERLQAALRASIETERERCIVAVKSDRVSGDGEIEDAHNLAIDNAVTAILAGREYSREAAIAAAVADEREACAAVCEKSSFPAFTAKCFAADIRARAKP